MEFKIIKRFLIINFEQIKNFKQFKVLLLPYLEKRQLCVKSWFGKGL